MAMGRNDVLSVLGPVDDALVAEIVAVGASKKELVEAWAWANSDESLINENRPLPTGKVAELIDLLVPAPAEDERSVGDGG